MPEKYVPAEIPAPLDPPMTDRERAVLDWIFRNARACPFADTALVDFDAECVGFGQAGCGECVLRNISELGKTD